MLDREVDVERRCRHRQHHCRGPSPGLAHHRYTLANNNTMTLHQQAQQALSTLNCSHPDAGVMEFQRVSHSLPGSHDAQAIAGSTVSRRSPTRLLGLRVVGGRQLLLSSSIQHANLEATPIARVEAFGHDSRS